MLIYGKHEEAKKERNKKKRRKTKRHKESVLAAFDINYLFDPADKSGSDKVYNKLEDRMILKSEIKIMQPTRCTSLPIVTDAFEVDRSDERVVYGCDSEGVFVCDVRNSSEVFGFGNLVDIGTVYDEHDPDGDRALIVSGKNNVLAFADNSHGILQVFDTRRTDKFLLNIETESPVRKLFFDSNDCFKSVMADSIGTWDFKTGESEMLYLSKGNVLNHTVNELDEKEMIICGDLLNEPYQAHNGFLNLYNMG